MNIFQDAEGKAPIHHAILNQHTVIISLLMSHPGLDLTLRDKQGLSPFAIAMTTKNNKAAQAILDREPTACEQVGLDLFYIAFNISFNMRPQTFDLSVRFSADSIKIGPTRLKNITNHFIFITFRLFTYLRNYWSHRNGSPINFCRIAAKIESKGLLKKIK